MEHKSVIHFHKLEKTYISQKNNLTHIFICSLLNISSKRINPLLVSIKLWTHNIFTVHSTACVNLVYDTHVLIKHFHLRNNSTSSVSRQWCVHHIVWFKGCVNYNVAFHRATAMCWWRGRHVFLDAISSASDKGNDKTAEDVRAQLTKPA